MICIFLWTNNSVTNGKYTSDYDHVIVHTCPHSDTQKVSSVDRFLKCYICSPKFIASNAFIKVYHCSFQWYKWNEIEQHNVTTGCMVSGSTGFYRFVFSLINIRDSATKWNIKIYTLYRHKDHSIKYKRDADNSVKPLQLDKIYFHTLKAPHFPSNFDYVISLYSIFYARQN
jgi:hypothetical protein